LQLLHQFVLTDISELRKAEGWYTLGDIYRTEGKAADAHKAFVKCIEYPNTPFHSRSLYYLAVEEIDRKNYEKAHLILTQIFSGPDKEIDRPAHEKAMYKMSTLLMLMENHEEAKIYLTNCVQLYPENQHVNVARQQLGDCCRRLAGKEMAKEADQRKLLKPGIPDDARQRIEETIRHHRTKRRECLTEAVKSYQILADELEKTAREQPLEKVELTLLRRALFGIGECHLDGEEFTDAIGAFQKLQVKHRRTVEGMYACSRICFTVEAMKPSAKDGYKLKEQAMESLRMLLEDVRELPADDAVYKGPGAWTRAEWLGWAEKAQLNLLAPPKKDSPLPAIR
jgi:tetratricopeptide (TPR) repeat protein